MLAICPWTTTQLRIRVSAATRFSRQFGGSWFAGYRGYSRKTWVQNQLGPPGCLMNACMIRILLHVVMPS